MIDSRKRQDVQPASTTVVVDIYLKGRKQAEFPRNIQSTMMFLNISPDSI